MSQYVWSVLLPNWSLQLVPCVMIKHVWKGWTGDTNLCISFISFPDNEYSPFLSGVDYLVWLFVI